MGYHYTMDAFCWLNQIVKDQEHRVRIELTPPLYESGVIPLDHQCLCVLVFAVGPVGIEPTSFGLRDRCITLSATIPFDSIGVEGIEPSTFVL